MPKEYIYEPWSAPYEVQEQAGCVIGEDYPTPLVDHEIISKTNEVKIKQVFAGKQLAKAMCPSVTATAIGGEIVCR